jgi:hypothetical protein
LRNLFKGEWERRVHGLRESIEKKWSGLKNNFENFFSRKQKQEEKKSRC